MYKSSRKTNEIYFNGQIYDAYCKILDIFKSAKKIYHNRFHDRYFIIDKMNVYHFDISLERIGYKTFSINLLSDEESCKLFINKINKVI